MENLTNMENNFKNQHEYYKSLRLSISMARGKPCQEQVDLSMPMLNIFNSGSNLIINGTDYRNYGVLDGIPECKRMFSDITGLKEENIIVYGNASLFIMASLVEKSVLHGANGGVPFSKQERIKWLCPVPGYDRHFAICEALGIEMINIPMNDDGPDMDKVEQLIKDPSVKGIWCVPKYSNPTGNTYSDEVVRRFAKLKPAASDFRIYWDLAYIAQSTFDGGYEPLLNIYDECVKNNNEDIVYIFTSTSKMTFPGSGVAMLGASPANLKDIKSTLKYQTIGYDKLNQYRHALFFKDAKAIKEHMDKHATILKPKFDLVYDIFEKEIKDIARWSKPTGGYFISLYCKNASEVVKTCKELGVTLTDVGAAYPYHEDPNNEHIRICPSYPTLEEIKTAAEVICLAVKMAYAK